MTQFVFVVILINESRHVAASVLLKMFISGNERWHTTDPLPLAHDQNSKVNYIRSMILEDKK